MFENLKKYVGVSVFLFIITLLVFGCMSLKTHLPISEKNKHENGVVKLFDEYKVGSTNFVFLIKEVEPAMADMCNLLPIPCEPTVSSTASGLVLSHDQSAIFVLTAAHFCVTPAEESFMFNESIIGFANDVPRILFPLKIDVKNDICLLIGPKFTNEYFYNIKLAKNLALGEEVYTVAAPLGIAGPGIRLIFKGNFGGCDVEGCLTTTPATFGSSGGGIYNKKGELISIVMAVPETFPHVVISPSIIELEKFISDIDKVVDIYSY